MIRSLVLATCMLAFNLSADESPAAFQNINSQQQEAVEKGLAWLAKNQNSDGSWASQGSSGQYRMAMTGLAGLAFLSAGHMPGRGPYGDKISKAIHYVLKHQSPDGTITSEEDGRSMYGHGFALTFLAEAYGMDPEGEDAAKIKEALPKAVKLVAKAQSNLGGWYYSPDSGNDEGSVTITQVQALRACQNVGIDVPKKTMQNALDYMKKAQNPDGGIRYQAQGGGGSSVALSAAGSEVLLMAGRYDSPETKKVVDYLKKNLRADTGTGHDFYTHFYATQAMYQLGGDEWVKYYGGIRKRMLSQQASNGSWQGDGIGTTYGTALAVMILDLPYNYLPIFQK